MSIDDALFGTTGSIEDTCDNIYMLMKEDTQILENQHIRQVRLYQTGPCFAVSYTLFNLGGTVEHHHMKNESTYVKAQDIYIMWAYDKNSIYE